MLNKENKIINRIKNVKEEIDSKIAEASKNSFSSRLAELIQAAGKENRDIYKAAYVDRKVFSNIINDVNKPCKVTAIALGLALRLDLETMSDFIARAGHAFSKSDTFDIIIVCCILENKYDFLEINEILDNYNQKTIGSI